MLGTLKRDGYTVEKLIFQTMPGVWMTANAYVPEASEDKRRRDPDGARPLARGPRRPGRAGALHRARPNSAFSCWRSMPSAPASAAIGKKLGEYHGEMVGGHAACRSGCPSRACRSTRTCGRWIICSRGRRSTANASASPAPAAAAIRRCTPAPGTTASRPSCPVCSVGNYQAYLGTGCCMCEVVPGALRFTEEWGVLETTAPRALMVINATKDGIQFSVGEAKKSLAKASSVYRLYDRREAIRHTIFESPHDYNQPMREAMYGWMAGTSRAKGRRADPGAGT